MKTSAVQPPQPSPSALRAARGMLLLNALLSGGKIAAGALGDSRALVADGINNLTDVGLSLAVVLGMGWAHKPPDARHPYGHGKVETEVARVVGIAILITSGFLIADALRTWSSRLTPPDPLLLGVAGIGILIKEAMFRVQRRWARRLNSLALEADALNHRSDAAATGAVFLGLGVGVFWSESAAWVDNLATLVVAALMGANAARIVWTASQEMLDEMPPAPLLDAVREAALKLAPQGVYGVEKVLGRKMGTYYVIDLHLEVHPDLPVQEAHLLGHQVREEILRRVANVADVLVHVEPAFFREKAPS